MRLLGMGLRFSFLALAGWGWLSGCSTRASESADGAVLSSRGATKEHDSAPQQVVQRIVGNPNSGGAAPGSSNSGNAAKAASGAAGEGTARAGTSAAVSRASGARAPRSKPAETITSKHLEAELNRLEAELAN